MAVFFDRVYPRKVAASEATSLLTPAQIATALMDAVESGQTWKVAEMNVVSQATGDQTTPVGLVYIVAKALKSDIAALRAVNPLDYNTAAAFKTALDAAAEYIPTATWIAKLQEAYDITPGTADAMFAELKAKLTPAEG